MFSEAYAFNQPLQGWDTSSVTDVNFMFYRAEAFTQPLQGWDTSSVTNMASMFQATQVFDEPLEGWDTSGADCKSGITLLRVYTRGFAGATDR